ncbi:VWA domain-containing protein [Spongisporangium articulatum]|uniref:VWA domain-containing protein n=1 Tax=Spongisporangium articulatum TaxID=3362603 RepID=A0ABW8AMX6_9ACTN
MGFEWPLALVALIVVPALLGTYLWQLRRRRRAVVPHPALALLRAARPGGATWRRHVPAALLLAALAALGLAAARPQARLDVPVSATSVILALDVSGSMCATDVAPNRLTAAGNAVREFVRQQKGTRIGLVAFAGFADVVVEPTTDKDALNQAIDALTTGRGTAIGAAILKSVDAIAQIDPDVQPVGDAQDPAQPQGPDPGAAVPAAQQAPEIVVLLTDGANTHGISPEDAAKISASRGVRVYPIGFGTSNPTSMVCSADQLGGRTFENFGQGQFGSTQGVNGGVPGGLGGAGSPLVADDATLRQVADTTGGEYFSAGDADQLQQVFDELPRHMRVEQHDVELSAWFALFGVLLAAGAVAAAVRWTGFPN